MASTQSPRSFGQDRRADSSPLGGRYWRGALFAIERELVAIVHIIFLEEQPGAERGKQGRNGVGLPLRNLSCTNY